MVRSTRNRPTGPGTLLLAMSVFLIQPGTAQAAVPQPFRTSAPSGAEGLPCGPADRSSWGLEPAPLGCQYRFSADGGLDELVVVVTLRDCFDTPITFCSMRSTLKPNAGTLAFCPCEDPVQTAMTDGAGAVEFRYSRIGGRGSLSVALTTLCFGDIALADLDLEFTSPDLNGSCEVGASTSIIDLGLWAVGLNFYVQTSDFNCSGDITITDLGLWAQGLGVGCGA